MAVRMAGHDQRIQLTHQRHIHIVLSTGCLRLQARNGDLIFDFQPTFFQNLLHIGRCFILPEAGFRHIIQVFADLNQIVLALFNDLKRFDFQLLFIHGISSYYFPLCFSLRKGITLTFLL